MSLFATACLLLTACSASAAPGTTWTNAADAQALKGVLLEGVAHGVGGFAAVGSYALDGAVLVSSDGTAWTRLAGDVFSKLVLTAVAADGSGFIAVGNQCPAQGGKCVGAKILRSADGRSFRDIPIDALDVVLTTVAVGGPGYIAAGQTLYCANGAPSLCGAVFFSSDGETWTPATNGPQWDDSSVNAVVPGGPGLVAVGFAQDADRAVVWTSSNGKDWQRATDIPTFANAGMSAVIRGGPGLLAVGWAGSQGAGAAVWTSPDGLIWTRVADSPELAGAEMQSVVKLDSGFVAIGWSPTGAVVWTSPDGTTWMKAPTATSFANVEMASLALGGKVLVAVGPPTPSGNATGIWTSRSDK